jgi:hypothetical protein
MKISELISALEKIKSTGGDVDVVIPWDEGVVRVVQRATVTKVGDWKMGRSAVEGYYSYAGNDLDLDVVELE